MLRVVVIGMVVGVMVVLRAVRAPTARAARHRGGVRCPRPGPRLLHGRRGDQGVGQVARAARRASGSGRSGRLSTQARTGSAGRLPSSSARGRHRR